MTDHSVDNQIQEASGAGAGGAETNRLHDLVIVGGGVSGLVLAREASRRRPDWSVAVLEAETRPGGTMLTDRVAGCVCEWGPNGFLTNVPHTWDLAQELGLGDRLLPADESAELRYLWVRGALRALPMKPPAFFTSDLLTLRGRLRVLLEPFMGRGPDGDESVYSFASRRIGTEAASVLVDAMVSGVYAGDPANLSLGAAFPRMAQFEREHGSLVKALIALKREARRNKTKSGGPMGPGGRLTSFDEGMEVLIKKLAEGLGPRLRVGARVRALEPREGGGYAVRFERGRSEESFAARRVVLSTPSFVSSAILKEHFTSLSWHLGEIPYAGINVACLIYEKNQFQHDLNGFGFLVPRGQGPRILGCIWVGSIFPAQVTRGRVVMRAMVGGARDPEGALLSEGRTVDLVHGELDRILGGIEGRPKESVLFRHAKGIPQYVPGHLDRLEAITRDLEPHEGLFLAGNAYRGIGVNDCVREAKELAGRITGVEAPASVDAGAAVSDATEVSR